MKPGKSYEIKQSACPTCGHQMDMTFCTSEDAKPKEGDVTLCIRCGSLALFDKDVAMRAATPQEVAKLSNLPEVIKAQILIRGMKR